MMSPIVALAKLARVEEPASRWRKLEGVREGREWIHGRARPDGHAVLLVVLAHVADRIRDRATRSEGARVIAASNDLPAALHHPVHASGDAHRKALHRPIKPLAIRGFDDGVDV